MNFEEACSIAYSDLSKLETVKILSEVEKRRLSISASDQVWEIVSEIEHNDILISFKFYLRLDIEFPHSLPTIYLSKDDYDKIKYIPHMDKENLICTFDRDLTRTDPENPGQIILDILRKAKQILSDGLSKNNFDDFNREFLSYWRLTYDGENPVSENILSLINSSELANCKVLVLNKKFNSFKYIILNSSETSKNFRNYLSTQGYIFKEIDPLCFQNFRLPPYPPFSIQNKYVLEYCEQQPTELEKFRNYYNSSSLPKIILFTINGHAEIYGWIYEKIKTQQPGFRKKHRHAFTILSRFENNSFVNRISPQVYLKKYLVMNNSLSDIRKTSFCLIGAGSIGSNLIHFLKSVNNPTIKIVDNDILNARNTGRHLLGLNSVGLFKSEAIRNELIAKAPEQNVIFSKKSIYEIFNSEPAFINESNYFFDCTGKTNVSQWFASQMSLKKIIIPGFFIWVEPYLVGGHCIYIHPNDKEYNSFFEQNGLFKYNIINQSEYECNNPILIKNEAHCNTVFTPYDINNVLLFYQRFFLKLI